MNIYYLKHIIVLAVILSTAHVFAEGDDAIRVEAAIEARRCYVGEPVLLRVRAIATGSRPTIEPPVLDRIELTPIGRDMRQIATTAIGDHVRETMLYRWDYRVIPFRVGSIVVPPFRVRAGENRGVGKPIGFEAVAPPASGRPDTFLGGIGRVSIAVAVEPKATRVGDPIEVDVILKDEGALGSVRPPAIDRLIQPKFSGEIRELEPSYTADPPERTYRFSMRPTTAGDFSIGPIAVATFDPASRLYQTRVAPSVKVHVIEIARFDVREARSAGKEVVEPIERDENFDRLRIAVSIGAGAIGLLILTIGGIGYRVWQRRDARSPGRAIAGLEREIGSAENSAAAAEMIQERLASYLHLTVAAPSGATTPDEAYRAIYKLTDDEEAARRGGALFAECDDARFGRSERDADRRGMIERTGFVVRVLLKSDPRPRRGRAP